LEKRPLSVDSWCFKRAFSRGNVVGSRKIPQPWAAELILILSFSHQGRRDAGAGFGDNSLFFIYIITVAAWWPSFVATEIA